MRVKVTTKRNQEYGHHLLRCLGSSSRENIAFHIVCVVTPYSVLVLCQRFSGRTTSVVTPVSDDGGSKLLLNAGE